MGGSVVCRSCGTENDDSVDFCQKCGEYLRWELTRAMPAAIELEGTPTPMPIPAAAPAEPEAGVEPPAEPEAGTGREAEGKPGTEAEGEPEPGPEAEPDPGPWSGHESAFEDDFDTAPLPPVSGPMPTGSSGNGRGHADLASNVGVLTPLMSEVADPAAAVAATQPQMPVTGGATLVVRRVGDEELAQDEAPIGSVQCGARIVFEFLLRNVSRVVDNYDLVVAGLPEVWTTTTPETAYLVPYGSGAISDQLVRVAVTPPRTSEAEARVWPFELIALSRASGGIAARAPAGVEVDPFQAWEVTTVPSVREGRFRGRYAVTVANRGNASVELWMYATESENKLRGRFVDPRLALSAGESRTTRLDVKVPRPRPLGRAVEYRATVQALLDEPDPEEGPPKSLRERLKRYVSPGGVSVGPRGVTVRPPRVRMPRPPQRQLKLDDLKRLNGSGPAGPLAPSQVTFRQKAVIPTWLILLGALVAALIAAYVLTRSHQVEVPELVGMHSTFAAQQALQQRGLTLNPTVRREVTSVIPPGTVAKQYPTAGTHVKKGTQVTVEVAVGTGKVIVPNLTGETRAQADTDLRRHGLSIESVEPITAPLSWVVASQIPVAGLSVPNGTAIQLFLHAKPKTKAQLAAAAATAAAATAATATKAAATAAKITVPPIAGKTIVAYAQQLGAKRLIPKVVTSIQPQPAGTLYAVEPPAGTVVKPGSSVQLLVSEGTPVIAYDNGTATSVVDPATGKDLGDVKGPDPIAVEPSFSPNGKEFVYRSATRIFLAQTAKPGSATPIYQGADTYTNATFAPDPKAQILALDEQLNGVGELCFVKLSASLNPQCVPDDGWSLGRHIAWAPNGKTILAFGSEPGDSSVFGIVRFTSSVPFSTNPADWQGSMATDVTEPGRGVIAAAFSANGQAVALVSNLASSNFSISLVRPSSLDPTSGRNLSVPACDVAWRPDGVDIAVVQSNATCTQATGEIVQVPINDLRDELMLASSASDVTYQGLSQVVTK